jgi:hypothetical protein
MSVYSVIRRLQGIENRLGMGVGLRRRSGILADDLQRLLREQAPKYRGPITDESFLKLMDDVAHSIDKLDGRYRTIQSRFLRASRRWSSQEFAERMDFLYRLKLILDEIGDLLGSEIPWA